MEKKFKYIFTTLTDNNQPLKWEEQLDGTHYCPNCGKDALYTFDGEEVCSNWCAFCGTQLTL